MTTSYCQNELTIFAISKFKFKNDNSVHLLLLLLSLNPGSFSNLSCSNKKTGKPLAERIISYSFNINSLPPKIDEFRDITEKTKPAVIGI